MSYLDDIKKCAKRVRSIDIDAHYTHEFVGMQRLRLCYVDTVGWKDEHLMTAENAHRLVLRWVAEDAVSDLRCASNGGIVVAFTNGERCLIQPYFKSHFA